MPLSTLQEFDPFYLAEQRQKIIDEFDPYSAVSKATPSLQELFSVAVPAAPVEQSGPSPFRKG